MNGYGGNFRMPSKATFFKMGLFAVGFLVVLVVYQTSWQEGSLSKASVQISKEKSENLVPSKYFEVVQMQRKSTIAKVCRQNHITPHIEEKSKFRNIIVNDRYKLLYCDVPKVASTNWKRVMLVLTGKFNTSKPLEIPASTAHSDQISAKFLPHLSSYSLPEIAERLATYTKFMVTREPMERLLSAYRNKFTKSYNKYFHDRFGRKIIKNYRNNATAESLQKGHDVLFHEFVEYLLDPLRTDALNPHWEFFYKLCSPCIVNYDIIGKYDTLVEDSTQVLRTIGADMSVIFPENRYPGPPTSQLMRSAFSNVTEEEIHSLWRMYSVDYTMFGYSYPNFNNDQR